MRHHYTNYPETMPAEQILKDYGPKVLVDSVAASAAARKRLEEPTIEAAKDFMLRSKVGVRHIPDGYNEIDQNEIEHLPELTFDEDWCEPSGDSIYLRVLFDGLWNSADGPISEAVAVKFSPEQLAEKLDEIALFIDEDTMREAALEEPEDHVEE